MNVLSCLDTLKKSGQPLFDLTTCGSRTVCQNNCYVTSPLGCGVRGVCKEKLDKECGTRCFFSGIHKDFIHCGQRGPVRLKYYRIGAYDVLGLVYVRIYISESRLVRVSSSVYTRRHTYSRVVESDI